MKSLANGALAWLLGNDQHSVAASCIAVHISQGSLTCCQDWFELALQFIGSLFQGGALFRGDFLHVFVEGHHLLLRAAHNSNPSGLRVLPR